MLSELFFYYLCTQNQRKIINSNMKTRFILLVATILMVVACGENSGPSTDPKDSIKQKEGVKEADASPESNKDLDKMPIDEKFYNGMLKIFCKKNYEAKFNKRFKALTLEDLVLENDSTVLVSGPLIFYEKETGDEIGETKFKANIKRIGQDKYRITFGSKGEKNWNDTTLTINYKQFIP